MPLLARGPGFGIKKISVLLALVTYFSMMQYSVRSKILSEKKVFLSTFHRCFRRAFGLQCSLAIKPLTQLKL